ncbi:unnamed protein product [Calypogeia fissa]
MDENTDSDLAIAVALAESNEGSSDDDFKPEGNEESSDDDFMLASKIPKKKKKQKQQQQAKRKPDKKQYVKGNRLVEDLKSGDEGPQRKVRKQAIETEFTCVMNCITDDSVKRTTLRSMAELDSFRYTGGRLADALHEVNPVKEQQLEPMEVSRVKSNSQTEVPNIDQLGVDNVDQNDTAANQAECLVIDIDTDEVVELCDDTQFSVLLRLCREDCEQDEYRDDSPDEDKFPTLADDTLLDSASIVDETITTVIKGGGLPGRVTVEGPGSSERDHVSTNVGGSSPKRLFPESAMALSTNVGDADPPAVQEGTGDEQQGSQDDFGEDAISSMMTQKCVPQSEEVKALHKISPPPLRNISNLPARVGTSKRGVKMKSMTQARNKMDPEGVNIEDGLDNKETDQLRMPVLQVPQALDSREGLCQNKENIRDSPSDIIVVEHESVCGHAMEHYPVRERHETVVEDSPVREGHEIVVEDSPVREGHETVVEDSPDREGHETVVEDVPLCSREARETIQCPVCGENINENTVEERLTHTNSCLDKLDRVQEGCPQEEGNSNGPSPIHASDDVKDWLDKLNLSRYHSLFVEQEIDWDTLPWLTEEDLVFMGISAIGPRRKMFLAIQELNRGSSGGRTEPQSIPAVPSTASVNASTIQIPPRPADGISGIPQASGGEPTNLITNYFPLPPESGRKQSPETPNMVQRTGVVKNKTSNRPRTSPYQNTTGIPAWMCIPGTPFRVDAFQYLSGNCSHWFLTHFHTDHYQGLTRGFRYGHIFCSAITAKLVNLRIGVSWEKLMIIPLHEKVKIAGVDVTFIDANHCPGSVMILFEPPNGEAVLHTGDFRFCTEMTNNAPLKTTKIHTLVLDTTYCEPQYKFPTQDEVIRFVIEAIEAEMFNKDTLFLIGTYTIGKERLFLEVGKVLKKYVYIGAPRKKLLDCMDLSAEDTRWLTCKEYESFIHVVPLWSISNFKRMSSIARHYQSRYKLIVAFSPTGWSFGRGKKKTPNKRWKQGTMIRYEVPYSEHCSFPELKEFLRFIAPEDIIPSVPNKNGIGADAMIASLWSEEDQ